MRFIPLEGKEIVTDANAWVTVRIETRQKKAASDSWQVQRVTVAFKLHSRELSYFPDEMELRNALEVFAEQHVRRCFPIESTVKCYTETIHFDKNVIFDNQDERRFGNY